MSQSPSITLSLYGCGHRTEALVNSVWDTGRVAVSCCYDLNQERARALAEKYGGTAVDDVAGLLVDPRSNAIIVCLFPAAHAEALRAAIDTGKPIYAEKPIATKANEARDIVERVEQKGVYVRVGFVQRYVPLFEKILDMIRAGEVGDLISIKHEWLEWASPSKTGECEGYNWRSDPATGGELLQHTGHFWDVLRLWAGEFESVIAQTNQLLWPKSPSENSVFARGSAQECVRLLERERTGPRGIALCRTLPPRRRAEALHSGQSQSAVARLVPHGAGWRRNGGSPFSNCSRSSTTIWPMRR